MVLKHNGREQNDSCKFENDVKMYGTQAVLPVPVSLLQFENDVKMYGTQAYMEMAF